MIRFIYCFFDEWRQYPKLKEFLGNLKQNHPETLAKMEKADVKRGIKPYKNRFDYAWRNAKIRCKDCRYTNKCYKNHGDCEACKGRKGA